MMYLFMTLAITMDAILFKPPAAGIVAALVIGWLFVAIVEA